MDGTEDMLRTAGNDDVSGRVCEVKEAMRLRALMERLVTARVLKCVADMSCNSAVALSTQLHDRDGHVLISEEH